jgi:hypothetical protein
VSIWVRAGAALVSAAVAGLVVGTLLSAVTPPQATTPRPGPVLETVTPAQLAAMSVRLDPAVQPVELPNWVTGLGAQLPSSVLLASDAEGSVRQNSGSVRDVVERVLARATVTGRGGRAHGPTIVHRLVWAVVGTRAAAGGVGGLAQVLWLVDAHSGRELAEIGVPAPLPGGGPSGSGP